MKVETLSDEPTRLIRRMTLAPGEATHWHTDVCRRFTVVVAGDRLRIEYLDGQTLEFDVEPGLAGWDEPTGREHRALNCGEVEYHEVVIFYRDSGVDPQPNCE